MSIILYFIMQKCTDRRRPGNPAAPCFSAPACEAPRLDFRVWLRMLVFRKQSQKTGHVHGVCRVLHFRVRVTVGIDSHGRIPVKAPTCKRGHPAGDFSPTSQRNAMELPDDLDLGYSPALMAATDFIKDPAAGLPHLAAVATLLDREPRLQSPLAWLNALI